MKIKSLVSLVFFVFVALQAHAQKLSPAVIAQVAQAEKAMFDATSNGDPVAFKKIAGSDYFTINADGNSMTLEEAVPFIPRFKGSTVELSEQRQRVFGTMVLRTGRGKIYIQGTQVAEMLYTSGWVYRDKRWQFVHWQGTLTGMSLEGKGLIAPPKN